MNSSRTLRPRTLLRLFIAITVVAYVVSLIVITSTAFIAVVDAFASMAMLYA